MNSPNIFIEMTIMKDTKEKVNQMVKGKIAEKQVGFTGGRLC